MMMALPGGYTVNALAAATRGRNALITCPALWCVKGITLVITAPVLPPVSGVGSALASTSGTTRTTPPGPSTAANPAMRKADKKVGYAKPGEMPLAD